MSRLILKGNTLSNTGEYFPSVYIEKIYLNDHGIAVDASVFVPHKQDTNIFTTSEGVTVDEKVYVDEMDSDVYYYVAILASGESEDYTEGGCWSGPSWTAYSGQNLYKRIIEGKTNMVDVQLAYGRKYNDTTIVDHNPTSLVLFKIEPFDNVPITIFDENGQEYLKYSSAPVELEFDRPDPDDRWEWDEFDSVYVLAFSSDINFFDKDLEEEAKDPTLVQKKVGDISYEPVWADGTLASRLQVEYIEASGAIYDQIPLQAINTLYYKINRITHDEIVDSIESLVTQFREDYKLDEVEERKYPALRSAIDAVSTVLELRAHNADIVPRLNAVSSVFAEKSLALPVGKFYKHLRKRLFNIDKLIRLGERLRKKVMYNGKIIDQRTVETSLDVEGSYTDHEDCDLLYRDWIKTSTYLYDWTGSDNEWKKLVYNGYYMFDYEKALRENSNLSRFLNVHALEEAGIHIPYRHYRVKQSYVDRSSRMGTIDWENGMRRVVDVRLRALMKENVPYPITEKMYVSDSGTTDDNSVNPNDAGDPYVSALSCTFLEGTWSHLMNRRFVDVSADSIETETGIQDYRLLAFELMDFSNAAQSPGNSYTATVSIEDNSMQFFAAFENMIGWINAEYHSYLTRCQQLCAANNTTDLFNAFFSETIMEEYEGNMNAAPWIRCPLFLLSIQHIVTGQWANRQEIIERAAIIVSQINPVNGNLTAVQAFWDDLQALKGDLLEGIKEEADDAGYYNTMGDYLDDIDWYDVETTHEYSCELPIADKSNYNDSNGLYPIETTECDDLFVEGEDTGIGTAGSDTSSGFRWVLMNIAETDDYGKNISSSEAKDVAKHLGANGSFDGNWESRRSNGEVLNEKWWDYTGRLYPANKDDYTDAEENGIKDKLKKIDQSESGATTNHDGADWNVNLIDHFQRLASETKVDEWYERNEAAFADYESGTAVAIIGDQERNEYYWYRFCWWGDGNSNSGFGILEYKCYYGNDPSTQCGYPDNKITSKARADTNWDGKLYSTTFTDSDGMEKAYEDGIGVIDVEREN